jgi:hypothetical protein
MATIKASGVPFGNQLTLRQLYESHDHSSHFISPLGDPMRYISCNRYFSGNMESKDT